jgi:hypothetical protein
MHNNNSNSGLQAKMCAIVQRFKVPGSGFWVEGSNRKLISGFRFRLSVIKRQMIEEGRGEKKKRGSRTQRTWHIGQRAWLEKRKSNNENPIFPPGRRPHCRSTTTIWAVFLPFQRFQWSLKTTLAKLFSLALRSSTLKWMA